VLVVVGSRTESERLRYAAFKDRPADERVPVGR